MKENVVQRQIIDYLKLKRYFFWRNNSGAVLSSYKGKTRMFRFGKKGSPDLFVLRSGKLFGIECKSPTGRTSPEQKSYEIEFVAAGGTYILARTLENVMNAGVFESGKRSQRTQKTGPSKQAQSFVTGTLQ